MTAKDYFLLGSAKYKCRACELAVKEFDKAVALDKDYAEAYYGRSLAYSCTKDYVSAMIDIDHAIRLQPSQVLYYEGKARILLESGKNAEAQKTFNEALRMDSLCWQAWYGLALAERKANPSSVSTKAFDQAIRLNPDFAMAYLGRAETNYQKGEFGAALVDLEIAKDLAPTYAKVFLMHGMTMIKLENYTAAIEDATRAAELDPTNGQAYYTRGEAYYNMEQYGKAELDFAMATDCNKKDGGAWFKRGICNDQLGDMKSAKKYYGKAIKKNRGLDEAYSRRAAIWEKMLKPKKAIPDLSNAIALTPDNVPLRLRRGFLYLQLSQVQLASDDFVHATQVDPNSGQGYYGLGMARYQNGNVLGACEAWKRAAELNDAKAKEELAKYCNE